MMIPYLLQVTLCLGCFYSLYYFALRKETLFGPNRIYLLVTLLTSMILPWIRIYVDSQVLTANMMAAPVVDLGSYLVSVADTIVVRPQTNAFSWVKLMAMIYTAGVCVLTIRLFLGILEINSIRRSGQRTEVLGMLCVLSEQVKAPFSFFNTIFLPRHHSFDSTQLSEVLAHESAHVRSRHSLDVLLMEIVCIVLWPSPFVYLYRKSLREVHEYAADAEVIKDTPWETYAQLLVHQQQHHRLRQILSNQFYSQLKKRLHMMNQKPSSGMARLKYAGIVPVLAMALLAFSFRAKTDTSGGLETLLPGWLSESTPDQVSHLYTDGLQVNTSLLPEGNNASTHQTGSMAIQLSTGPDMPVFPGCGNMTKEKQASCNSTKMMEYVLQNLVYPETLRKQHIEGKVMVRFVVSSDGWVKKPEVIKSLTPEADQAALDLVNSMNHKAGKWQPAYRDGKAVEVELVLPITFALAQEEKEEPYAYVEEMPRFPGCEHIQEKDSRFNCVMEKMFQFIGNTLQYPEEDRKNKIEGTGIVQFVVQSDGQLSDYKVLRSPSPSMAKEMIRLMDEMTAMPEKWIPGRHEGKAVPVKFTLPIKFILQDNESSNILKDTPGTDGNTVSISLTPNPASSTITVQVFEGAHTLQIYGANGRAVLSDKIDPGIRQLDMDVSSLSPGQYVVKAQSDTASAAATLTIVR